MATTNDNVLPHDSLFKGLGIRQLMVNNTLAHDYYTIHKQWLYVSLLIRK